MIPKGKEILDRKGLGSFKRSYKPHSNVEPVTGEFSDWATLTCRKEIYGAVYGKRRVDFNEGKNRALVVAEHELTTAWWIQDEREGIRTGRRKSYESIKMNIIR